MRCGSGDGLQPEKVGPDSLWFCLGRGVERVESDELNPPETLEMQMSAPVGFSLASNKAMAPHQEQGCLPIGPSYAKVSLNAGTHGPDYWVSQPSNTLGPIISTASYTEIRPLWQWRKEYHDMVGLRTTKNGVRRGLPVRNSGKPMTGQKDVLKPSSIFQARLEETLIPSW